MRRVLAVLIAAVIVLSVAMTGRVVWVAAVPTGDGVREAQIRHLEAALRSGAGEDMQQLFPEGYFFTYVLTGLAAAQPAAAGDGQALSAARSALAALDSPAGRAPFPGDAEPPYGAFWSGWSLALAIEVARLSGTADDRADVLRRARPIATALTADSDGFLESYPGQVWPVDTVVAVAALARAQALVPGLGAAALVADWTDLTAVVRDPTTGLLPHRLAADGSVLQGPRASSQTMLLAFEPDIDDSVAAADYRRFVSAFVVRRAGLVGVLEYPRGVGGPGDVDSGPLIAGVSLSASTVALAAARRQGDTDLAAGLDAEAEFAGVPLQWSGERRYAFGVLPVGDAFLAWARAQRPVQAGGSGPSDAPSPLWPLWALLALAPAALLLLVPGTRRMLIGSRPVNAQASRG